jgi:hypothetical protein
MTRAEGRDLPLVERLLDQLRRQPRAVAAGVAGVAVVLLAVAVGLAIAVFGARPTGDASMLPSPSARPSASPTSGASQSPASTSAASTAPTPSLSPTLAPAAGWTTVEIAGVPWVAGIAERGGRLVAIGREGIDSGAAVIAYSDDGVIWTPVDTAQLGLDDGILFTVAAGVPGFVAIGGRITADYSAEDLYFYSADGSHWQPADAPEHCAAGYGLRAVGSGFINFGQLCVSDGLPPPGPTRVVTSTDGRSWTSRLDAESPLGPWTTDGERIVMLVGAGGEGRPDVSISDDVANTWRQISDAFPAGVTVYNVAFGHDRYVAEASWLIRPGDPDHAVCVSDTGETWACEVLSSVTSAPEDRRAVGSVTSTSSGFASLVFVFDDQFAPSGSTMIIGTSTDGLAWTFATEPAMKDALPGGLVGTSHGIFAWGSTYHGGDGSVPQEPYVLVHLAPLP